MNHMSVSQGLWTGRNEEGNECESDIERKVSEKCDMVNVVVCRWRA